MYVVSKMQPDQLSFQLTQKCSHLERSAQTAPLLSYHLV